MRERPHAKANPAALLAITAAVDLGPDFPRTFLRNHADGIASMDLFVVGSSHARTRWLCHLIR